MKIKSPSIPADKKSLTFLTIHLLTSPYPQLCASFHHSFLFSPHRLLFLFLLLTVELKSAETQSCRRNSCSREEVKKKRTQYVQLIQNRWSDMWNKETNKNKIAHPGGPEGTVPPLEENYQS